MRLINAEELKEIFELYKSHDAYGIATDLEKYVENAPTVKAITIDRLAEIFAKETEQAPCEFLNYDCEYCKLDTLDRIHSNYKSCWKEFFEHYAEVEE